MGSLGRHSLSDASTEGDLRGATGASMVLSCWESSLGRLQNLVESSLVSLPLVKLARTFSMICLNPSEREKPAGRAGAKPPPHLPPEVGYGGFLGDLRVIPGPQSPSGRV